MTRPARSRLRAYLALARVSNLPTVWTNVLAGMVLSRAAVEIDVYVVVAISVSLLYSAGMAFNDVVDLDHDRRASPDRPLPAGDLTASQGTTFAVTLMTLGTAGLVGAAVPAGAVALATTAALTVLLCLAILYYNVRHKTDALSPLVMGLCRGLVYCVAAAVAAGSVGAAVAGGAALLTVYTVALTLVAKYYGREYGWTIPWLIAGICLVDAALIASAGAARLAAAALAGFPLTLAAQRIVKGT
ncbi:MAG TPA: UbiA family prenyltransferase [Vicinamibacterales bacterium]|nr:UbiA family prenyltransferase [Vicinamibacterales bacterium]